MGIAPALAEILLQVFGAFSIDGADALLDVGALLQAGAQAEDALFKGSVDKDVKDIGLVLENALSATAHDDAVAIGMGFFDDLLGDFDHLLGIEDGVFAQFQAGGQGGRAHGLLVDAPQP